MKLSVVLSTQPAAFEALAYTGQIARNVAKIKSLGYDGVELAVRNPGLLDVDEIDTILQKNSLPVPAIGTGQAYGEEGLSLTHPDASIRQQAIDRLKAHIELAARLDAVVILGLLRGTLVNGVNSQQAETWLLDGLTECAAENEQIKIAIEPLNRYETTILNTVSDALRFLDVLGKDNVGLLLDTFHMNIEEPSMLDSIRSAKDKLFHFHVADSNRWYPGAGHIDFQTVVDELDLIGYSGFVSGEMLPLPDSDTAVEKTVTYMRALT